MCNYGFEIVGNSSSLCDIHGSWNPNTTANCQVRACPPLEAPDNGQITPEICKVKPLHGQNCSYECNSGYIRIGSGWNMCDNGHWRKGIFHCRDVEAPSFGETCPTSRSVHAEKGTTSATVTWGPVKATDNHQASVTVFPKVTPPHIFTEGNHTVIYSAKDPSGNMKLCSFKVTVQGLSRL